MTVRFYTRRSKNDEGKQQFSLEVQVAGCRDFLGSIDVRGRAAPADRDGGGEGPGEPQEPARRAARSDLRRVLRTFPEGLRFLPARVGGRQVWKIAGETDLTRLAEVDEPGFTNEHCDPRGT